MNNQQVTTENRRATARETLLTQQLSEAMKLIRQLQRNNAEIIKQNTDLMRTNSLLITNNRKSILTNSNVTAGNEEDTFINDILSLINDKSAADIDKKPGVIDNYAINNDSITGKNDNNVSINDNKTTIIESNRTVNDNKPEEIEINGKIYDKKALLEKLRFGRNILWKQNLSDDQLIAAFKNRYAETIKAREKADLEKMKKVPALYYLDHDPKGGIGYEHSFDLLLNAYRKFKYRNKKNTPSLVKQIKMLLCLYKGYYHSPREIFNACNLTNITGYRYAAKLSEYGLIRCTGRGNTCQYNISQKGKEFLENTSAQICYWKSKPAS